MELDTIYEMRLTGQVALVTGGGTGIGAAVARLLAQEGASVVITGRRAERLEAVAAETGAATVRGDVRRLEDVRAAVATAVERFGGLDVVVANAGTESVDWDTALGVHLTGTQQTCSEALPHLIARGGGSIVIVSSVSGLVASPGDSAYATTKGGLVMLARSLAVTYGPQGVRVNALCPGWVRTPMADREMDFLAEKHGITREQGFELVAKDVPLRRVADPDEIARVALFLASSESSFVTGAVVVADGGSTAVDVATLAYG
jgi:meso-butanediol dehydrogenase / (S,S)-butanediol dehydrogenase / diacetyl reductase